jgi:transposase
MLIKYKEQQNVERGFAFLKAPLFFGDSVFLKSPRRIEAMAMLRGLCLMVYSIGQREANLDSFSLRRVHTRSFYLFHPFSIAISDVFYLWG